MAARHPARAPPPSIESIPASGDRNRAHLAACRYHTSKRSIVQWKCRLNCRLGSNITELPLFGSIPYPLVFAAVIWSLLGTGALALIGIRLPRIEFLNQRVEAAYRKELVLGEDSPVRADPPTLSVLFSDIRRNYFRLYLNFMYFNIGRIVYLQTDVIFPYILLAPTIIAGKITLGAMNQILNAFTQVRTSFQYLVNSWSTIVELISIYQRLRGFEAKIHGEPLPLIETQKEPAS